MTGIAAGHGGSFTSLPLPATASRHLFVPALLALFFAQVREPSPALLASTAAAAGTLALIHPTYALFVGVPLVGFAIARAVLVRRELARALAGIAALAVPTGIALAWLRPVVEATTIHNPSGQEVRRALAQYRGQLVGSFERYHVAAQLFTRSGAVAIAGLLCVPLAFFAARRRWAAWVLGGSLAIFALTLVPFVFPRFADAVSISQGRRLIGFMPIPYALAGGATVLVALLGIFAIPLALAAGIALELAYTGDFGYRFHGTTPAWPTWVAAIGGVAALVFGAVWRYRNGSDVGVHLQHERLAAAAVARLLALDAGRQRLRRSHPRPDQDLPRGCETEGRPLRRPRDRLPARRLRAGLSRRRTVRARGRDEEEPAEATAARRLPLLRSRR